ncbi:hypothetical protein [Kitasatospora sp. GAS204B]|uniref:hypothetical protein n=1 Tax=unclassified Kitasatospora TaxID=2633591 RepID=UPI002474C75B|nr:hypothetical protein [Kitasatospora sp. GAS204B]
MSTRTMKTVSAEEMAAIRAEYLAAQAARLARGTHELVNTAWCDCPKHQLYEGGHDRDISH